MALKGKAVKTFNKKVLSEKRRGAIAGATVLFIILFFGASLTEQAKRTKFANKVFGSIIGNLLFG